MATVEAPRIGVAGIAARALAHRNAKSATLARATFYKTAPADYYAMFWHANALGGRAYGFPYDDVGSYSSFMSHANPQYMLVAIGW